MNIGHHGSYVSSTVGCFWTSRIFEGLEVSLYRGVEVHGIAFIERVDFSSGGNGDLSRDETRLGGTELEKRLR